MISSIVCVKGTVHSFKCGVQWWSFTCAIARYVYKLCHYGLFYAFLPIVLCLLWYFVNTYCDCLNVVQSDKAYVTYNLFVFSKWYSKLYVVNFWQDCTFHLGKDNIDTFFQIIRFCYYIVPALLNFAVLFIRIKEKEYLNVKIAIK